MKVTLITGASSGIGEEFARRLAAEGHNLVLVARSEKKLQELCDELMLEHKIMAHYVVLDLSEFGVDRKLLEETDRLGYEVDWVINNAGFGSYGDFARLDIDHELRMLEVNIVALVGITHAYLPQMRERRSGTIINVSSAAGFQPIPFMATYAATKSFVTSFSEAIAEENRPFGIKIQTLCPGSTKTNFQAAAKMEGVPKVKGQQTVDEVVDTSLRAVKTGRTKVVSGFTNNIVSKIVTLLPNPFITRMLAKGMRSKYQGDQ